MRRGLVTPVILICTGGLLLANNVLPDFNLGHWWPVAVIGFGTALLLDRFCNRPPRIESPSHDHNG
jgi:Domain of unknown function (DUF5668)